MASFCSLIVCFLKKKVLEMIKVLLIVTTFNRRDLTIKFLESIRAFKDDPNLRIEIDLIDDNSSDGTQIAIKQLYPEVRLRAGTGFLYWSCSLRYALREMDPSVLGFDGVLLANDDIEIFRESLIQMIEVAHENNAIVGASIVCRSGEIEATGYRFGKLARPKYRRIQFNGYTQECDVLPGHLMYMPIDIFKRLTPLSEVYSHGFSDFDLSLNARQLGIKRLLIGKPGGLIDEKHNYSKEQSSIRMPIRLLIWRLRFNPKSPPLRETSHYLQRVSKYLWPIWLFFFYLPNLKSMLMSLIKIDCVRILRSFISYFKRLFRGL
jgi:GT2 family glycosyltransferase